jgi:hypothetical protein
VGHLGGEAGPVVVPIEPVVLGDEEQEQGGELLPARQLEQPPPVRCRCTSRAQARYRPVRYSELVAKLNS